METVKTLKLRIKDKHAKALLAMARDVNTVWNFCNAAEIVQKTASELACQQQDIPQILTRLDSL